MSKYNYTFKQFKELTINELYDMMVLRQEVFVVEQDCPYVDADNKDQKSHHLMVYPQLNDLGAYTRIVEPGVSYDEVSIGRVITAPKYRGTGLGVELMDLSIKVTESVYGKSSIRISAQEHLQKFYNKFGFEKVSEVYLEDNIPHIEMLRSI